MTRLEEIEKTVEECCWYPEDICYHCKEKLDLMNIACAWAFDFGARANDVIEQNPNWSYFTPAEFLRAIQRDV